MYRSSLFIDYNCRTNQNNFYDIGVQETGLLGQTNSGSGFFAFTSADFVDPGSGKKTDCPFVEIKGLEYRVFWNEASRFLYESELADLTDGGFSVLIPDFDASLGDYHFYVSTLSSETQNTSIEPITLADAKDHLRIDFTEDDAKISRMIKQCRRAIENLCNISIVSKQISATLDLKTATELPLGPVQQLVFFKDNKGNDVDATYYELYGEVYKWIRPTIRQFHRCKLVYTTGTIIEEDLNLAILNELAFRYENRGETTQNRQNVNPGVCYDAYNLASPYIREIWR